MPLIDLLSYFHRGVLLLGVMISATAALREVVVWRSGLIARSLTPAALEKALDGTPTDATKWRLLGIAQLKSDAASSGIALRRAVELNRFDTEAFLGLAILAEAHADYPGAESFYLHAIESSHRFNPACALASFYARRGRTADFWHVASAAAAIDKADVARIVRIALTVAQDSDSILSLLNLRTDHSLSSYLAVALAQGGTKAVAQTALRLPATPDHAAELMQACNRLIDDGAAESAVAVWNRLGRFTVLNPAGGRSLTNGAFSFDKAEGFNWRHRAVPGVQFQPAPVGLRLILSGKQAEDILLLEQVAPVLPDRQYRLSIQSKAVSLPTTAGLFWQVQCAPTHALIAAAGLSTAAISLPLHTPPECLLVRTMLIYRRQLGTVRIAGDLDLLSAELELLP